jgi:alpha-mannosidase
LPQLAATFDAPLLTSPMPVRSGKLPPRLGLISLEPEALVLSAIKRSESGDRLVLRCYNSSDSRVEGRVQLGFALAQAWWATASEQATCQLDLELGGTACEFEADPHAIVTLLLCPEPRGNKP